MKELILHLGFHKTGSSSIQRTCFKNRKLLERFGYYYPVFEYENRTIVNHSESIYSLFTSNPKKYHINVKNRVDVTQANRNFREQLNRIYDVEKKVILSGEDIAYLTYPELCRLRDEVIQKGVKIRVICFVRSPYSFVCSNIQQRVKKTGVAALSELRYPRMSRMISKVEKVFNDVEFYPFDRVMNHTNGLVYFFFELLGVHGQLDEKFLRENSGVGNQTVRFLNYLNEAYPRIHNDRLNSSREQMKHEISHSLLKGTKFLLLEKEYRVLEKSLVADNDFLRNRFGDDYCDRNISFSPKEVWDFEYLARLVDVAMRGEKKFRVVVHQFISGLNLSRVRSSVTVGGIESSLYECSESRGRNNNCTNENLVIEFLTCGKDSDDVNESTKLTSYLKIYRQLNPASKSLSNTLLMRITRFVIRKARKLVFR